MARRNEDFAGSGQPSDLTIVVTPIYEDEAASKILFQELARVLGGRVYVVAVDDGSVNQPVDSQSLADAGLDGVVLKLKRNVGHQRAIAIGIGYVAEHFPQAPWTVVMDSDGEDLPGSIADLLGGAADADAVVAQRKSRVESLKFKIFYLVYKRLFRSLTGKKISFGNFMGLRPAAVRRLAFMPETWTHVAASVVASKLRLAVVPLARGPRYAGKSKMNFVGLALHGLKALMVFAEEVLVRVGIFCTVVAGFAVLGALVATGLKLGNLASPGWYSMTLGILAVVFLQASVLGLISLMTLMLTGGVRGSVPARLDYEVFVESVHHAGS